VDAEFRLKALDHFLKYLHAKLGTYAEGSQLRRDLLLRQTTEKAKNRGTACLMISSAPSTGLACQKPNGSSWLASTQYESEMVYHSIKSILKSRV
jgi:hypothetical protein